MTSDEGENLRQAPNGPIVGRAREGTLLRAGGRAGQVVPGPAGRVGAARGSAGQAGARTRQPAAGADRRHRRTGGRPRGLTAGPQSPGPQRPRRHLRQRKRVETLRETALERHARQRRGDARCQAGTPARVIGSVGRLGAGAGRGLGPARRTSSRRRPACSPGSPRPRSGPTPERFVGQTLEWRLQIIAVQTRRRAAARDAVRPALPADPRSAARARVRLRHDPARSGRPNSRRCRRCRS